KVVEVRADGSKVSVQVTGLVDAKVEAPASPPSDVEKPSIAVALLPTVTPPPEPLPFWTGLRIGGAVLGGVGLVAVGFGAVFGGLAISNKNQSGDYCGTNDGSTDPNHCNMTGRQLRNASITDAAVSTGTFIAGGAVLAAGITLFAVGGATRPKAQVS